MSPRPRKFRRCQCNWGRRIYKPRGIPASKLDIVVVREDELEALRLCDVEGLTQDEAGERMHVSRGTIQRTVKDARKKVIGAILDGVMLELLDGSAAPEDIDSVNDSTTEGRQTMPGMDGTGPDGKGRGGGRGMGRCGGGQGRGMGQGRGRGQGRGMGQGRGQGQGQGQRGQGQGQGNAGGQGNRNRGDDSDDSN